MWIECSDICKKIRKKVFVHPFGFLILALPQLRILVLQEVREMIRNNLFCYDTISNYGSRSENAPKTLLNA